MGFRADGLAVPLQRGGFFVPSSDGDVLDERSGSLVEIAAVDTEAAVANYIEAFYNRIRLHSTLGYRTPAEALAEYYTRAA